MKKYEVLWKECYGTLERDVKREKLPMSDEFLYAFPCDLPAIAYLKGVKLMVMDQIKKRILPYLQNILTLLKCHDFGDIQIHKSSSFPLKI